MTPEQKAVYDLQKSGLTRSEIASELGISPKAVKARLERARRWVNTDPSIADAANAGGLSDPSVLSHMWKITKDEQGNGYSMFIKNPDTGDETSFKDMVADAVQDGWNDKPLPFEPRKYTVDGDHLLVIDLADVHFGKLCVKTETGYEYNRDVARHRVIEGTKSLLNMASGFGVGRILFVMGNDILHVDNDSGKTTKGTKQDTDGSLRQMYSDAQASITAAIKECANVADVDLIHCMSNHDKNMGWSLTQTIAAGFAGWPTISATKYNISDNHRKYYGYENNGFVITHADGAKDEKLLALFVAEARQLLTTATNLYALLHHFHHAIRKRRGVDVFQNEKDHICMTSIVTGSHNPEGSSLDITYVRSPSPPDSWHHKYGFLNRQGVEAFVYHPQDGKVAGFTTWF